MKPEECYEWSSEATTLEALAREFAPKAKQAKLLAGAYIYALHGRLEHQNDPNFWKSINLSYLASEKNVQLTEFKAINPDVQIREVKDLLDKKLRDAYNVQVEKTKLSAPALRHCPPEAVELYTKHPLYTVKFGAHKANLCWHEGKIYVLDATATYAKWLLEFLIVPHSISKAVSKKSSKASLPKEIANVLRKCYAGTSRDFSGVLPQLRKLRDHPNCKELLVPPTKYKVAYRVMVNIEERVMARLLGESPKSKGVVEGGTYKPQKGCIDSCWTVDANIFSDGEILRDIGLHSPPGRYMVMLIADLASHRDSFLYNPDTLPKYLRAGNYGKEREVLGVGPIPLVKMVYFKYVPDDKHKPQGDPSSINAHKMFKKIWKEHV